MPLVLGTENVVLNELIPDLVSDLRHLFEAQGDTGLPLSGFNGLLHRRLEGPGVHRLAIDLADGSRCQHATSAAQAGEVVDEPDEECNRRHQDDRLGGAAKKLHHEREPVR